METTATNTVKYLVVNNGKFLMSTINEQETEKAIKVNVTMIGGSALKSLWLPKSVIISRDADNVNIASWFLAKNPFNSIAC
jgi:hypothetical protein